VVVAPLGRDGDLICTQLTRSGFVADCLKDSAAAIRHAREGVGAVIVTDEALDSGSLQQWHHFVERQPGWSDLPFILLTSGSNEPRYAGLSVGAREALGNVTILDRPVRIEMLVSAANSCLRARRRQYEIRDHIERRRAAEEALRESEKLAVAGRLAASIAHEINNPLEGITNLVFLINASNNMEEIKRYVKVAEAELQRVSEIVSQTLRFHRTPTKPSQIDLNSLISSSVALFKAKLREKDVELTTDLAEVSAYCSAGEVRQSVVNLIGNALDAMPHGGGRLHIRLRSAAHPRTREAGVRITISDTGDGIPEHVRKNIFQQFFTTKGNLGTGLGLWLTKDIVTRNNGVLSFRSRTKKPSGTVFSVWLPAKPRREASEESSVEEQRAYLTRDAS
jgi:signal transduction histidine kinase